MSDGTRPAVIKLHDDGPLRVIDPVTVLASASRTATALRLALPMGIAA